MPASRAPTILIGLDGLDWEVIHPLLDAGLLPNLRQLVDGGVSGNLATLVPTLSPMLWNSIATGKRAGAHGIHGFTGVHEESGSVVPVSSLARRCKAIWNIFEQSGLRTAVVNWFASHPAEPLPTGAMVSDFYPEGARPKTSDWPLRAGTIFPPRLADTLAELRVHPGEIDVSVIGLLVPRLAEIDQTKDPRLARIAVELSKAFSIQAAATWLLEHEQPDFLAVYFRTPDLLSHFFMPFHPPRMAGINEREYELYHEVINGTYRLFDLMLGAYLRLGGPKASLVVLSDHGFQSGARRPTVSKDPFANPEGWHRPHGVLILHGPAFRPDDLVHGARLTDIVPTLLALHGLPVGQDMGGRVLAEAFVAAPEVKFIESWENVPGEAGRHGPDAQFDPSDAEILLQQFVALGYITPPDADRAKAAADTRRGNQWNLARDYLDAGMLAEALPILEELNHFAPDDPAPAERLAACLLQLGLAAESEAVLTRLVRRQKPGALRHLLDGQIALQRGHLTEALAALSAAGAAAPGRPQLDLMLGRVYVRLGRWTEATAAFERVLANDPDHAEAHQGMALVYLRQRYWELAAASALRATGLQFNLPRPHFYLGLALERLGQREPAIRAFDNCLIFAPNFVAAHRALVRLHDKIPGHENLAQEHRDRLTALHRQSETIKKSLEHLRTEIHRRQLQRNATATQAAPASTPPPTAPSATAAQTFVIVSGLPRSGTSLMMQMLRAAGLPLMTDARRAADEDNPEGYWEWEPIKDLPRNPSVLAEAAGHVVKVVAPLLGALPRHHRYRIIFMDRLPAEVAASQEKMLSRRTPRPPRRDPAHLSRLLADHRDTVLQLLRGAANIDLLVVNYGDLVSGPSQAAERIAAFLGLPSSSLAVMAAAVKPSLHRNRQA